jgi:hypothetical protein
MQSRPLSNHFNSTSDVNIFMLMSFGGEIDITGGYKIIITYFLSNIRNSLFLILPNRDRGKLSTN